MMIHVKATWSNGQVVLDQKVNWEEGRRLVILGMDMLPINFMTEEEQGSNSESIQEWIDDLHAIPTLPEDQKIEAEQQAWDEKMRQYNLEAVRKQFEEGIS